MPPYKFRYWLHILVILFIYSIYFSFDKISAICQLCCTGVWWGYSIKNKRQSWFLLLWGPLGSLRRRQWHPTPVLLPGKSYGWRSLVGCSPWGREESDTTERLHFHFHALEKEMAPHSSVCAWRIPGTVEPGRLQSMGSHRVGHDWSDLAVGVINPAVEKAAWWNDSELKFWSQTESESGSIMSDSLQPQGLYSPWNSLGQNTGVGNLSLLQGIFPVQWSNSGLPHCRQILYQLCHKGSPRMLEWAVYPFSSRSSQTRNQTGVSWIAGAFFTNWIFQGRLVGFKNVGRTSCKLYNRVSFCIPVFPSVLSISAWQISQCRGLKQQASRHDVCGPGI